MKHKKDTSRPKQHLMDRSKPMKYKYGNKDIIREYESVLRFIDSELKYNINELNPESIVKLKKEKAEIMDKIFNINKNRKKLLFLIVRGIIVVTLADLVLTNFNLINVVDKHLSLVILAMTFIMNMIFEILKE